ncbi:MAG: dTDP-glucose 4,6-dehydratase [Muribaculaceae bacterium]|nr:dTDP-glucose 4,6-dehydratase [Muribaculaceae bacterium]
MKTRYLVTGGAGFIGANFVKHILEAHPDQVEVLILDALTYAGNLMTIEDELKRDDVHFVKGDIGDKDFVEKIIAEFDPHYVVNFAAESHVDRSITNPRLFLETNILGTHTLLDACRKAWRNEDGTWKPDKKFLQISTDEVYGSLTKDFDEAKPLVLDDDLAAVVKDRTNLKTFGREFFTETTPLAPKSPYSASKTSADMMVLAYSHTYGLPVNITRCSNNYGPYHFPEKLIPLTINNILQGRKIPVYGKGANVRDWLYVTDHARAIDLVLRTGKVGEIYNIGGFNEESNLEIVKTIIATIRRLLEENDKYRTLCHIPIENINEDLITYVTDRPGHDMRYAINPHKIATQLGWYPLTPFVEGIEKTVRWYLDNPDWTDAVTSGEYMKYYNKMYENR